MLKVAFEIHKRVWANIRMKRETRFLLILWTGVFSTFTSIAAYNSFELSVVKSWAKAA